jgi:soluble lytic murein transglycosylase-like protein
MSASTFPQPAAGYGTRVGAPAVSRDDAKPEALFARSRRRSTARRRRARRSAQARRRSSIALVVAAAALVPAGGIGAGADDPERAAARTPTADGSPRCPVPRHLEPVFASAARDTRLPVGLLVALAHEESRMDPSARSRKGAVGLLQLMPSTARALGADPHVAAENVRAGARYLSRLLSRFGDLDLALAAYNAGPSAVARAGGAPSLETLRYVLNVRSRASALSGCG